jgi:hypothetical protein
VIDPDMNPHPTSTPSRLSTLSRAHRRSSPDAARAGANYGEGTGERAYPHVATYPKFEYVTPEEAAQQPDDGIDPVEALREKLAAKHEVGAIQEFKDRLDFAMGRVGSSLKRGRRKRREIHAGTGKSTILIKPLGRDQKYEPWVATPGKRGPSLSVCACLGVKSAWFLLLLLGCAVC